MSEQTTKAAKGKGGKPAADNGQAKACPITRELFWGKAPPAVRVDLHGDAVVATAAGRKEFASTGLGYYANGTVLITVDGVPVKCPCQIQIFIPNSKELPK